MARKSARMPWVAILRGDVDHVGVAHAAAIDFDVGHLHAAVKLVEVGLQRRRVADLGGLRVSSDCQRGISLAAVLAASRTRRHSRCSRCSRVQPDNEAAMVRAALVGDETTFSVGLDAEAGGDGVARAGGELRRE